MKRVILLHTIESMYLTFEKRLREAIGYDININNILDTFFASDMNAIGYFSQHNLDRLYLTLKSAELTGADAIAVICSSLSPHVEKIAPLIPIPIIRIDERLGPKAIAYGDRITILASAKSAIEPTATLIRAAAKKQGKDNISIDSKYDLNAFHAIMRGDKETHDEIIIKMGSTVCDKDVIVFAQGSMEHVASEVSRVSGIPVVTAPSLCIQQIKELIEG